MKRSGRGKTMGSSKLSADYRKDCARAEKQALQTLRNVHMPVINIPSIRDITLANYRRRMVKCDRKVRETGIVLVAATDFVAACLSSPALFGWNVEDTKEQVSGLLADLGRRWTQLLSADRSRRSALLSLLETSLRCLDNEHRAYFQEAREVGKLSTDTPALDVLGCPLVLPKAEVLGSPPSALPKAEILGSPPSAFPKAEISGSPSSALPKAEILGSPPSALPKAEILGSPSSAFPKAEIFGRSPSVLPKFDVFGRLLVVLPKIQGPTSKPCNAPTQRTLASFFAKGSSPKAVAASNEGQTHVFSANRALLLVDPANHGTTQIGQGYEAPPPMLPANGSLLPLVNATNVAKSPVTPSVVKTADNVLLAMMKAAKENKRKSAANGRSGPEKRARKGC